MAARGPPSTRLYYYRSRYYDPRTGRFLGEDPIGFASGDVNLYAYVANNPVNFVDPSGELWSWPAVGLGTGLGAVGGFFWGLGGQTVNVATGSCWDWGAVAGATAGGAVLGATTGAAVGATTGDPSALLIGGSVSLTLATAAGGGFAVGATEAGVNNALSEDPGESTSDSASESDSCGDDSSDQEQCSQ